MINWQYKFFEKIKTAFKKILPKGSQPKRKLVIGGPRERVCSGEC